MKATTLALRLILGAHALVLLAAQAGAEGGDINAILGRNIDDFSVQGQEGQWSAPGECEISH
jgi:hypothetical protein